MIEYDSVPASLQETEQWICWKYSERSGQETKVPLHPIKRKPASVTDPRAHHDLETVGSTVATFPSVDGIGFVFTEDDPFIGVDLDHCRDSETGQPDEWAKAIIEELDSFTEVSPSGTGYHVYVRGALPDGGNRSGDLELYDDARFFTVTGEHVEGTPDTIIDRQSAIETIHAKHIVDRDSQTEGGAVTTPSSNNLHDETLLSKARTAKNGEKFSRLWRGDTSGYESHSEADMALCFMLAFWSGGDAAQMDRLFRNSGLYRDKWDEPHYADGSTYGARTIERAVVRTTEFYEPGGETETADPEQAEEDGSGEETMEVSSRRVRVTAEYEPVLEQLEAEIGDLREQFEAYQDLETQFDSLKAQHEYLHEQLSKAQADRERLASRVLVLESEIEEESEPLLTRFLG